MINEGKTKYMIVTIRNHETSKLKMHNYNCETVTNFKYLEVDINENADSRKEIKLRLVVANECHFCLMPLFKSKMLSWRMKIT